MELIIVLAIVGVIIAFLVMQRRKELSADQKPAETVEAAYKLEAPVTESAPVVATPVAEVIPEAVIEVNPTPVVESVLYKVPEPAATIPLPLVVQEADIETPAVKEKKPRKPRAPKVVLSVVGEQPVKAKRKSRSKKV